MIEFHLIYIDMVVVEFVALISDSR